RPLPRRVPRDAQLWCHDLAGCLRRNTLRQDAVSHEADYTVLRLLIKLLWHVPNFPIYSNGTKPGALQSGPLSPYAEWNPTHKPSDTLLASMSTATTSWFWDSRAALDKPT